ncbi:hypothetical protein ADJ73_06410 [Arsenicicoccus sp. oral taxon 190]|nr:hypothetical protein ADJ73_06410 [Arsenicicoccus sp. oral taxon 190]
MDPQREATLRRRYLSLGVGELVAAAVFLVIALQVVLPGWASLERPALWGGLAPLLVILVQAGAYWLLARSWTPHATMPPALATTYRVFRGADLVLLAAGLVLVVRHWPASPGGAALALGAWAFGVVEYLNYFVVRLSYPVTRWPGTVTQWRTPRLMQDVRGSRPRG